MKTETVFKSDGLAMSEILKGCVDLIPVSFNFDTWRIFQLEKIIYFWAVGKCSKVNCTVLLYWHKKSSCDFGLFYLKRQLNSSQVVDYNPGQKCWNKLTLLRKIEI